MSDQLRATLFGGTAAEPAYGGNLQVSSVLCPVDLSEVSRSALAAAARIAARFSARLYVQHTFDVGGEQSNRPDGSVSIDELPAELQQKEIELREMVESLGVSPLLLLNRGDARQRILETIAGKGIDLLVMGTRARRALSRFLNPSVAEQVMHQSPCPSLVLTLAQSANPLKGKFDPQRLRTILVPMNLSANSARLLVYALRWASQGASRVILFHAVPRAPAALDAVSDLLPEYGADIEQHIRGAWSAMRAMIPPAGSLPCEVSCEVRDGDAKDQILQVAREKRADLIIMGARVLKGSAQPWGSSIAGVVRDGHFPVLAVRHLSA